MSGKNARLNPVIPVLAIIVCLFQQGCGTGTAGDAVIGIRRGTVNSEGLKVGVPEEIISDAVLTFVLDEQAAAKSGKKNQYLSRSKDSKGGQFAAQCKDDKCFRLEAIYATPISKQQALDTLAKMLPTSASAPKLKQPVGAGKTMIEKYDCGENFGGELTFTEPNSNKVRLVAAALKPLNRKARLESKDQSGDESKSVNVKKHRTKADTDGNNSKTGEVN